jgi:RHS repeat-associated protein
VVVSEDFGGSSATPAYDHAGNLITDAAFVYVYDAWNRLVKVRSKNDADVTIQTAEFDALGRRIKKVVSKSGEYDKTEVYLYDGQKIIEIRNGSNAMVQQFIHGTQYIDELVMIRVKDKGDLYVHQDANWNVVGLTDLGGHLVERDMYSPYGELTVHQSTGYGDRDGDGDVDSTDKGTVGTTCTGTVSGTCRILDLGFDGDYEATDATKFDSLAQGLQRNPGRLSTAVNQPFAHQGLLFEPEIGSYQNRARQYDPGKRRFAQRDPLAFSRSAQSTYVDGMNLYSYGRYTPLSRNDPSGFITVTTLSQTHGSCGSLEVTWDFTLNVSAGTYCSGGAGWLVQRVNLFNGKGACVQYPACGCTVPSRNDLVYWEAWRSESNSTQFTWPEGHNLAGYTDKALLPGTAGCGTQISNGDLAFYCESEVGDLRVDENWPQGGVVESGVLPSTMNQPAWWDYMDVVAGRSVVLTWTCCNGVNEHGFRVSPP